jgi:hypothetical protein
VDLDPGTYEFVAEFAPGTTWRKSRVEKKIEPPLRVAEIPVGVLP